MGQQQSLLKEHGYALERETENGLIATKDDERFLITTIKISKNTGLIKKIETLKEISHPHIMSIAEIHKDDDLDSCHIVTKYCEGGSLAEKIKNKRLEETEALDWIVEVCIALTTLHERNFLHEDVTPQNVFLTEFGKLCLGGFLKIAENSENADVKVQYLAPEVFTSTTNDAGSEVWSLGCILYEICTQQPAFSEESTVKLVSKIVNSSAPGLDNNYSAEFRDLLSDMLNKDPASRPTAREILGRPIILRSLLKKSKTTVAYLQTQLNELKEVAVNLEQVHKGTTIGSLTGGVIGAAGGVASIVGLVLAPFTLGASLIVTGVGVGVGVVGGVTAGASNITNMVKQSSNRKAVKSIIKEFDEKINAIAIWLQEIGHTLQTLSELSSSEMPSGKESFPGETEAKVAARVGRSIGTAAFEVLRHVRVANIGRIAAQAARTVRVAEVATGALSGLFVAFDIIFIAMDAKEIHNIRQTKADGKTSSEIMKFVHSVRESEKELQGVLDEFDETIKLVEEEMEKEKKGHS